MASHLKSIILCLLVLVSVTAFSQIPRKISYQGVLTLSAGTPATDGNYTLMFNIFENPTGGTSLYAETHVSVPVSRGTFKVILGSVTTLTLPFDRTYYLEMTVTAGPNITSSVAFPRTDFTSTPYALRADTAEFAKAVLGGTGNVTLPFPGTVDTSITPLDVTQNGTGGGISVQIDNVDNNARALNVATTGGNDAIYSQTLGTASAGNFSINNTGNYFGAAVMATSNGSYSMYSQNNGNGSAGEFLINSPTSTGIALNTQNSGTGYTAKFAGLNNLSKGVFIDINSAIDKPHLTLYEFENDYSRLSFQNGSVEGYWTIAGVTNSTASSSRLNFYSSQLGADAMSITGSGNVGIGTTTPSAKFEVVDNANAANMKITGSGTWGSQLELNPTETGSKRWMLSSVGTAGASRQGNLEFTNSTDGTTALALSPTGAVTISGALKPNGDAGTAGKVLQSNGANNAPTWVSVSNVQYNNIIQVSQSEETVAWSGGIVYPLPGMLYTLNIASHSKVLVQVNAVVTAYPPDMLPIRGDFTQTVAPAANMNSPIFSKIFGVNGAYFEPTFLQFLIELDAGSYVFNTKFTRSSTVNNVAIVADCIMILQVIPQ